MFEVSQRPPERSDDLHVELLERAIDEFAELDHRELSGAQRRRLLIRLQALHNRLDAQRLRLIGVVDSFGDVLAAGAVDTKAWLRHECHVSNGAAGRDIRAARRLRDFPAWSDAFAAGDVTRAHVDVLVKAATPERVERLGEHESLLLAQARQFAPDTFAKVVGHACEVIDDDRGAGEAWAQIERRRVHLSSTLDGMGVLDGLLDPESTEVIATALARHMTDDPDKAGETRSVAQRRADALVAMARHTLACTADQNTNGRRRGRPHIIISTDLGRLTGHDELVAEVRREAQYAGRLSTETLLRLTCDAEISRVLTHGKSEIIDVGRRTRAIPPAMWAALVARDGGCTRPGCDAPWWQCEAHHIVHWAQGGPTNLDNLELLCWRGHRHEHEGHPGPDPPI